MGWSNSPPIFSTDTETIADLANRCLTSNSTFAPHHLDDLAQSILSPLPPCPLVTSVLPALTRNYSLLTSQCPLAYADVFVDDFVGAAQEPQLQQPFISQCHTLQHHIDPPATPIIPQDLSNCCQVCRALLHSIDDVFQTLLPNDTTECQEPVSLKKL
jgi:hypothetical protein